MSNFSFGNKYFIFSKFSSIPKTIKIEEEKAKLQQEYADYKAFKSSDELNRFIELSKYLESHEHKGNLDRIQKGINEEEGKIKSFDSQKKSKKIKTYFKFKDSQKLKDYQSYAESKELARFVELKELVTSANFNSKKNKLQQSVQAAKGKNKGASDQGGNLAQAEKQLNDLLQQEKEYKQLSKSRAVKFYFKFKNSSKYKVFVAFGKSSELDAYQKLEKYLNSEAHKEKLSKLKSLEQKENGKIKEHADFKNSKKYIWFKDLESKHAFDELKKWKVVFEDDFSSGQLDLDKWMTRYYWGDKLVDDAYALDFDEAFPTDGKNIEVDGNLRIVTRKEKVEGKKWKVPFGFVPQEFDYTSGLASTAKSFRMKYGKIEAKIKVNFAKPVSYNFWMASENNLPHVDILKLAKNKTKFDVGHAYGKITDASGPKKEKTAFTGLDVSQDYFIYTLEWTREKLLWKINDVVVHEQKQGIPQEKMYLVFSSGITEKTNGTGLPASMEVDWVRCYQEA